MLDKLAGLYAAAGATRDLDEDLEGDPPPVREVGRLGAPWPKDARQARKELETSRCHERVFNSKPGSMPERREDLAYVPTSHGLGFRYNWKITDGIAADELESQVEIERAKGWRIFYLTLSADGLANFPYFDVLWVCDDDSNFNSGIVYESPSGLESLEQQLKLANRRAICVVTTASDPFEAQCAVVWIEDGKYISPAESSSGDAPEKGKQRWIIRARPLPDPDGDTWFADYKAEGFRCISAAVTLDGYVAIYVLDERYKPAWFLWMIDSNVPGLDPIAAFQAGVPDGGKLLPICLDIKAFSAEGDPWDTVRRYLVLAVEDPDVASVTEPGEHWVASLEENIPDKSEQQDLKVAAQRVYAFSPPGVTQTWSATEPNLRHVVVTGDAPTPHCRAIYDVSDGDLPFEPNLLFLIEAYAYSVMKLTHTPAVSFAIADPEGFRIRAAYTFAPWCYPDTYPETRFRVFSTSKPITAIATWVALESIGGDEKLRVFEQLPEKFTPDAGDYLFGVGGEYPANVLETKVGHLLLLLGGWLDGYFHPGGSVEIARMLQGLTPVVGEMEGWRSLSGNPLLPIIRDDYFLYMTQSDAFASTGETLKQQVGWDILDDNHDTPPMAAPRYSGFGYDLLGGAIQGMLSLPSEPRSEFSAYADFTTNAVLKPLGASYTVPGRSSRQWVPPQEAIYRAGSYLEEALPPVASNPFGETLLYSAWTLDLDPWGYALDGYGEDEPEDLRTPRYTTEPYGRYRLESGLPRGGWISSSPDLCRFMAAYSIANPLGLKPWTWVNIRVQLPNPKALNLGGLKFSKGLLQKGGTGPKSGAVGGIDPLTDRRSSYARVEGTKGGFIGPILALLKVLGI